MEKWICKEVLGENLSPLNMLDRCLITFSHYQSLTSKSMTISTSSPSVNHIAVSFSNAPESRSPTLPPLVSPPLTLLPSSRNRNYRYASQCIKYIFCAQPLSALLPWWSDP